MLVAAYTLAQTPWTPTLQHYSRCAPSELGAPARLLHSLFLTARTSPLPAAREKFSHPKFSCVAGLQPAADLPQELFLDVRGGTAMGVGVGMTSPPVGGVSTPSRGLEGVRVAPEWSQGSNVRPGRGLDAIKAYHGSRPVMM